jgi:hypothetical protein
LLRLEQLEINSGTLAGTATGRIACNPTAAGASAKPQAAYQLDLTGQFNYDLEKVALLLRPSVGPSFRAVGRGSSTVTYRGPLSPDQAEAKANVKWDAANVCGMPLGPGELKATLAGGVVDFEPLDLPVGQGHLLLAPRLRLALNQEELTMPPGPLARQVQVTPEVCNCGLQFIAPMLANATSVQGAFSIDLDGCRIPLRDPAKGELAGRLTIHSMQISPGPLTRELATLLARETPADLRHESVVPFRMVEGRIYHEGLELVFPDLTIRTHGSVGLDKTVSILAEMPVPPKWLGSAPISATVKNQTISLPIGGTLDRPQLDPHALEQLTKQFLQNATRNVIEDQLGRQLDHLFGPTK